MKIQLYNLIFLYFIQIVLSVPMNNGLHKTGALRGLETQHSNIKRSDPIYIEFVEKNLDENPHNFKTEVRPEQQNVGRIVHAVIRSQHAVHSVTSTWSKLLKHIPIAGHFAGYTSVDDSNPLGTGEQPNYAIPDISKLRQVDKLDEYFDPSLQSTLYSTVIMSILGVTIIASLIAIGFCMSNSKIKHEIPQRILPISASRELAQLYHIEKKDLTLSIQKHTLLYPDRLESQYKQQLSSSSKVQIFSPSV